MPYIKIWIHLIWTTKNRYPFLKNQIRSQVISHIRENAKKKDIHLDFINAVEEHVHSLISLNADQSIAKVAQLLKGESSHWINKNKLTLTEFGWQDEYEAYFRANPVLEVFYEDLVSNTQEECDRILRFLNVPRRKLSAGTVERQRRKPKQEIIANLSELKTAFESAAAAGDIPPEWMTFLEEETV